MTPASTRVMNLAGLLTQTARRLPDAPGLIWGEARWTWAEIDARVGRMAHALTHRFGLRKGDRVLVQSPNCNQMFESQWACFRAGLVWVPVNARLAPEEVAWLGQASGARGIIVHGDYPDHAAALRAACPDLVADISIGGGAGADYDAVVGQSGGSLAPVAVQRDDPCWFFFTSGTTGRPKAAVLTHGQMAFVVTNHLCDLMPGTTEADASLVVAPLSHGAGVHQMTQVARGAVTVLPAGARLDPAEIWALFERYRISNAFTVPTILKLLVEHPAVRAHDHGSLRYLIYAGAPMYRADQVRILETLGPVIVQYFGLGEVTGNITVLPPAAHSTDDAVARPGTCGYARTGMEVQIQDETGACLPPGATGEICVTGPAVFAGYHDNPEANAKAFRDGWFRTGDLGHMDAQGFVYITGRASDMYISGGSNIYPREIEEKILAHPDVSEVAVLGVPDAVWGEVGWAVCVAAPGTSGDGIDLAAWLDGKLARYKMPRRVIFWDALPKSGYGKITKKLIAEELRARGLWPDAPE
jgi:acyl-CoA synthetase (AMP-forming)/AMP-acid ligase II